MGCLEMMDYEILLAEQTFQEGRAYIKQHFKEVYEVEPGYKLFDLYLIGMPPIWVGVDGEHLIFPYVKPCRGTFVVKVKGAAEIPNLRKKRRIM